TGSLWRPRSFLTWIHADERGSRQIRAHPRQSASKTPSAPRRREEFGAAQVAVAIGVLAVELGAETLAVLLERDGGRIGDVLLVRRQDTIAVHVHLQERETHPLQELLQRHPRSEGTRLNSSHV